MEGKATVVVVVVTMPGMALALVVLPRHLRTCLTPGLLIGMARLVDTFSSMSRMVNEHGSTRDMVVVVAMDNSLRMAVEDTEEDTEEVLRDMVEVKEEGMEEDTRLNKKNRRITV